MSEPKRMLEERVGGVSQALLRSASSDAPSDAARNAARAALGIGFAGGGGAAGTGGGAAGSSGAGASGSAGGGVGAGASGGAVVSSAASSGAAGAAYASAATLAGASGGGVSSGALAGVAASSGAAKLSGAAIFAWAGIVALGGATYAVADRVSAPPAIARPPNTAMARERSGPEPRRELPVREAPGSEAPGRNDTVREADVRGAPAREPDVRESLAREAPGRKDTVREADVRGTPGREADVREARVAERSVAPPPRPRSSAKRTIANPKLLPKPGLAEETLLIEEARALLRAKDPAAAMKVLETHARTFESGALAPEAEALAVEAALKLGDVIDARARRERFERAHPQSPLKQRIQELFDEGP